MRDQFDRRLGRFLRADGDDQTLVATQHLESPQDARGHLRETDGRGSRVRFAYGDRVATFHRPHPAKEARPYQVEDARAFLEQIGVTP